MPPILMGGRPLLVAGVPLLDGSAGTPSPTFATTFSIALSASSGTVGAPVTMTVAPVGGAWPAGAVATAINGGLTGSFDAATHNASGTTSVSFAFTTTAASGPAKLNASVPGMTSTGGQFYMATQAVVAPPPTPIYNANRYDVVLDQSVVAPGATVTGTVYPNGLNVGGAVTLPIAGNTINVPLPSSGSASTTFSFTAPATAGEYSLTPSNTASMNNPYPPPLNVFGASSGTARTIAASLVRVDQSIHQQDTVSGTPRGFTPANWGRGSGEVWFTITSISGATDGLWARPYSAFSAGASGAVGTGTALDGVVQVYGPISSPGTVRVLLPAGPRFAYWDLATDAAFTNPIRIQQRTGVGHVIGVIGRSILHTMTGSYAYGANQIPLGTNYPDTSSWTAFASIYGGDTDTNPSNYSTGVVQWFRNDGASVMPWSGNYSEGSSSGAQERARLIAAFRGVITGVVGVISNGAALDALVAHDGTPTNAFTNTLATAVGNKIREVSFEGVTQGNEWTDTTYPFSTAETFVRYKAFVAWVMAHMPSVGVITMHAGASGWFGQDGSRDGGFTRNQAGVTTQIAAVNPMISSRHDSVWNDRQGGHPTMVCRIAMAQSIVQQYQMAEAAGWGGQQIPYAQRGPVYGQTATISGNVIRVPIKLNGGASLVAHRMDAGGGVLTPNYSTPSAAELASMYSVYPGTGAGWGNGTPVNTTGAVINTSGVPTGFDATIDITLFRNGDGTLQSFWGNTTGPNSTPGTQPYPSDGKFTVQLDMGNSNTACAPSFVSITHGDTHTAIFLTDDRADVPNGVSFGREIQPAIDIAVS